jgi:transcriptional regulator with XRE-family HTH domain
MKIGQRIRAERESRDPVITRKRLAELSGVPYPTLAGIENGDQDSSTQLPAIAAALGVVPAWLQTGKGPKLATESQAAGLNKARLDATIEFLEQLFESENREFDWRAQTMLITEVYDDLAKPSPMNTVALTKKYAGRISGENNERQGTTGSAGEVDHQGTRKRARKKA